METITKIKSPQEMYHTDSSLGFSIVVPRTKYIWRILASTHGAHK